MAGYKHQLTTTDLWSDLPNHVGSDRHCSLIDKLDACQSLGDEELLQLHEGHHTLAEIAATTGRSVEDVEQTYRRIMRRANKKA